MKIASGVDKRLVGQGWFDYLWRSRPTSLGHRRPICRSDWTAHGPGTSYGPLFRRGPTHIKEPISAHWAKSFYGMSRSQFGSKEGNSGTTYLVTVLLKTFWFSKVSWVRHKDVQILSVGSQVFTTDSRFHALHWEDEGRFTLVISRVQPSDEGTYECQISTKPTKSLFINLLITSEKRSDLHLLFSPRIQFLFQHHVSPSWVTQPNTWNIKVLWT